MLFPQNRLLSHALHNRQPELGRRRFCQHQAERLLHLPSAETLLQRMSSSSIMRLQALQCLLQAELACAEWKTYHMEKEVFKSRALGELWFSATVQMSRSSMVYKPGYLELCLVVCDSHVSYQITHTVTVAPLIVVPGHQLHNSRPALSMKASNTGLTLVQ